MQLVGTVFFNVSTFHALDTTLNASEINRLVWRPDALGSVCFLVASGLAWAEVGHGWLSWRPADLSWRIAALNLGGSIAFGVSAAAAKIASASGAPRNVALVNLGTFVGALGFLVGGVPPAPRAHPGTGSGHPGPLAHFDRATPATRSPTFARWTRSRAKRRASEPVTAASIAAEGRRVSKTDLRRKLPPRSAATSARNDTVAEAALEARWWSPRLRSFEAARLGWFAGVLASLPKAELAAVTPRSS